VFKSITNINLPNRITLFRIFVVPLIIVFLIKPSPLSSLLAALLFGLAAATDWLDGHLARTTGQVTTLGKLLDPIADKILILSALVPLVGLGRVPAWLATILIGREIAVGGVRSLAAADGLVIAAGKRGKYKTGFEIAAMEFLILNWDLRVSDSRHDMPAYRDGFQHLGGRRIFPYLLARKKQPRRSGRLIEQQRDDGAIVSSYPIRDAYCISSETFGTPLRKWCYAAAAHRLRCSRVLPGS